MLRICIIVWILCCGLCTAFMSNAAIRRRATTSLKLTIPEHPSFRRIAYEMGKLDIRVGKILSCKTPESVKGCYVCEVDVGEGETRTIVSRLTHVMKKDVFYNRDANIVVCCNTLPVEVNGVLSRGNIFYAKSDYQPVSCVVRCFAKIGTQILTEGIDFHPVPPSVEANCAYLMVMKHLYIGDHGHAFFDSNTIVPHEQVELPRTDHLLQTRGGDCVTSEMAGPLILAQS